jgi:hypothetical protein
MSADPDSGRQRKLIIISAVILVSAVVVTYLFTRSKSPADIAAVRVYMCSETGKIFEHKIREGEDEPIYSPYSKKNTGYVPEACYWTKGPDGKWKAKLQPTYVILESKLNPGERRKTYCPDCGREVRGHNPLPPERLMKAAQEEADAAAANQK